jgi:serine/threonine-protein kinase RsbW/sigma-B regulation protein RsbU (phosphoserine phosphatase)
VDYDSDHFDVTQAPRPATDVPLKNREVGGLGLLLVKHMVDSLRYEYADRRSTVSFTRTLGTSDVRDQSR